MQWGEATSRRASSGMGGTSTSRLVPNLSAAARVRSRRAEAHDSESDVSSVLSATPPMFASHQGSVSSQGSPPTARPGTLSTAMERVIRVERKRAGEVRPGARPREAPCAPGGTGPLPCPYYVLPP